MGAVPAIIRVVTDDLIPLPVDGVLVQVYTDPGDVFFSSGLTGVTTPGEVELTLDGDAPGISYLVRMSLANHSFPGQPHSILVKDPPAPSNDFEFTTHVGPTALIVKLVLKDSNDVAVDGARARIYDNNDVFYAEGLTGALTSGEADFALEGVPDPGQQYIVRWRPPLGYQVVGGNTKVLQVLDPLVPPAVNIFDFVASPKVAMESPDPLMCRLSGYLIDSSKRPLKGVGITFQAREGYPDGSVSGFPYSGQPTVIGGNIMASPHTRTVSDKNGFVMIDLPRTAVFDVHFEGLETPGMHIIEPVYIPDVPGINLQEVLFPYITEVIYSADPINVIVGETTTFDMTISTSNLQIISETVDLITLLDVISGDENVALLAIDELGQLLVTGLAVGSTTLEATRRVGTFAPRLPEIPALIVIPPSVLVTL